MHTTNPGFWPGLAGTGAVSNQTFGWGTHPYAANLAAASWGGLAGAGTFPSGLPEMVGQGFPPNQGVGPTANFGPSPANWGAGDEWSSWQPRLDAWEEETGMVIELEMAGVDPESIEVELDQFRNLFTVVGKRGREPGRRAVYRELPAGSFRRSVPLPWPADEVEAEFADGILQVRVPKTAPPVAGGTGWQQAGRLHEDPRQHAESHSPSGQAKKVRPKSNKRDAKGNA